MIILLLTIDKKLSIGIDRSFNYITKIRKSWNTWSWKYWTYRKRC